MATLPAAIGAEYSGRTARILERLAQLYPALIDLSLGRLERLLEALGRPQDALAPVIHVAGTNGKGSTCANLRAIGEAAGWRVHVMTSPHLVDVTERFRIAGSLVSEEELVATIEEVERVNGGQPITIFEVLTAAGFLMFSRHDAELVVLEVGLGGRFDATNVITKPAACAISTISMDHEAFLGNEISAIAGEKAGIIKPGVPVATSRQQNAALDVISERARVSGAPLWAQDHEWAITPHQDGLRYRDGLGALDLPHPALGGTHQTDNSGLAIAALRASKLSVPDHAWRGIAKAHWPARMHHLHGALADLLPAGWELWLDGGHNPGAGIALSKTIASMDASLPTHLIVGMKQTKDATGFLRPLLPVAASIQAVAERDQHLALPVEAIVAATDNIATAIGNVREGLMTLAARGGPTARVVICGSLYLAGVVLRQDGWKAT